MLRTLLTGIVCLGALSPALGEVINVPAGADSNALQAAMDKAGPGDTVRLAAGIYRLGKTVNVTHGGSPGQPLIIEGAGAGKTILKGSKLVENWQETQPNVWKVSGWTINSQQLFVDGQSLQQIGAQNAFQKSGEYDSKPILPPVGKGLDDLVPGSFFYDTDTQSLYCMLPDRSDPNGRIMEASIVPGPLLMTKEASPVSHVVLRKIGFLHNNSSAENKLTGLVTVVFGVNWTIEDCVMNHGDGGGLTLSCRDSVIRRCDISHNGVVGVGMGGNWREFPNVPPGVHKHKYAGVEPLNVTLEDSNLSYNNYRNFNRAWSGGGMKLIPGIKAVTIRNCHVTHNNGAGIWFDGALGSNRVLDNFTAYNNGAGVFYEISNKDEDDEYGVLVRNNRAIKNKGQGIYIAASSDAIVENNTCYGNAYNIVLHGMPRRDWGWILPLKNNRVENNIVGGATQGNYVSVVDMIIFAGKDVFDNTVDNNFYADNSKTTHLMTLPSVSDYVAKEGIRDLRDPEQLKAVQAMGYAQGIKLGDPMWVDPMQDDFRLKPDSPAAGMGWNEQNASR
ncbi:MAG: right-handed parallel beta-helix repeat-containing protein [Phycisphaerales bacterium]|nr:right-handed parallel beta-helix repeat-containing protein [Phycisphaerales bacterium]